MRNPAVPKLNTTPLGFGMLLSFSSTPGNNSRTVVGLAVVAAAAVAAAAAGSGGALAAAAAAEAEEAIFVSGLFYS